MSVLFLIVGFGVFIGPLVLAIVALSKAGMTKRGVILLTERVIVLEQALLDSALQPRAKPAAPPRPEMEKPVRKAELLPAKPSDPQDQSLVKVPAGTPPVFRESLEQKLASRWLVWLGGITLALGGVFLVKHVNNLGLISPMVRIGTGLMFGAAFVLAGEWVRRRPAQKRAAALRPDYVPAALTASGLVVAYGSLFAGYAIYDLMAGPVAFGLLTIVSLGAVALALLQGPFIAALGLAGSYLVPALIGSQTPSIWGLSVYLLVITCASIALVRWTRWWWLAWSCLAGSTLWFLALQSIFREPGHVPVLGMYIVLLVAEFAALRSWTSNTTWKSATHKDLLFSAAFAIATLLLFSLIRAEGYGPVGLGILATVAGVALVIARRESLFEPLAGLAATITLLIQVTWPIPHGAVPPRDHLVAEQVLSVDAAVAIGPEVLGFAILSAAAAILFGAGAFLALRGSRRPGLWAGLSAGVPIVLLIVAYWRIMDFALHPGWSAAGLVLAALLLAAAGKTARQRDLPGMTEAFGIYAIGVTASLSLAATMGLENAWLTVALAIQLPALAWVHERLEVPLMRPLTLVLASVILIRLALNPYLLDYPLEAKSGFNWILYGYGVPLVAFWGAARWFRRTADDRLVVILESGAILLSTLLLSMGIRHFAGPGGLMHHGYGLAEQSLHSIAWAGTAYGLYRRNELKRRFSTTWGWRILAAITTVQVLGLQALLSNPLWSGASVWHLPFINLLLLAYGLPAVWAIMFRHRFLKRSRQGLAVLTGIMALGLVWLEMTLEVRHLFHGPVLTGGNTGPAELYAYSVLWLAFAGLLLGAGAWRGIMALRQAGLGMLLLVVVKVFLVDLEDLEGLWRVGSFIGLGLSLVGVSMLYQRLALKSDGDNDRDETLPSEG